MLAGGRSRRFGEDKTVLRLGGLTLVERAADTLRPLVDQVLIADRGRGAVDGGISVPEEGDQGPAGGILAAARLRPRRPLLVLACDLPFVPAALLERLLRTVTRADWVVPLGAKGPEPAVSAWSPRAVAVLERRVAEGRRSLRGLLDEEELVVETIETSRLDGLDDPELIFLNVNRSEDFRRASELFAGLRRSAAER